MAGETPSNHELRSPSDFPSTSSVAQFFAQACEQEQKQQHEHQLQQPPGLCSRENEVQQSKVGTTPEGECGVSAHGHLPGTVLTGGIPGVRLPLPTTSAPMQGDNC